jgi:hypothetical protein
VQAGDRARGKSNAGSADPECEPHGRYDDVQPDRQKVWARGFAGGHHHDQVFWFCRTVVRCIPVPWNHAHPRRRVKRLSGQGTVRREDHCIPSEAGDLFAGRDDSHRKHFALWRDARRSLFLRHGR